MWFHILAKNIFRSISTNKTEFRKSVVSYESMKSNEAKKKKENHHLRIKKINSVPIMTCVRSYR